MLFRSLAELGAVVVKSLAAYEWSGNPAPRVHPAGTGMVNAVGLQGPGVEHWLEHELPGLLATGATVVASIWGRGVDDYRRAAEQLAAAPAGVVAVEVNLSCPNLEGRRGIFAHDADLSAEVIRVTSAAGRPNISASRFTTSRSRVYAVAIHVAISDAARGTLLERWKAVTVDMRSSTSFLNSCVAGTSPSLRSRGR